MKTSIALVAATREDMLTVWRMQVAAFSGLLEKYRDHDTNPGAEGPERVMRRFEQPGSIYYFIVAKGTNVGVIRVIDTGDGSRKRISPLWIMPEYRGRGYAQQAIRAVEALHGADHWCLDTIQQEKGNRHLYEKLGYRPTGRVERINERMDIIYYEKDAPRIRPMTIDDYDAVYALWTSCKNVGLNDLDDSRTWIEKYLNRNPNTSFVAEAAGHIVGVILSGHDGRRGYIYHLCVAEDRRGQGIGTRLVEHSLAVLKAEGINKVALLVFKRNEAGNAFWEHLGFAAREDVAYRNKALAEIVRMGT